MNYTGHVGTSSGDTMGTATDCSSYYNTKCDEFLYEYKVGVIGINREKESETSLTVQKSITNENRILCSLALLRLEEMPASPFPDVVFYNRAVCLLSTRMLTFDKEVYVVEGNIQNGYDSYRIKIERVRTSRPINSAWLRAKRHSTGSSFYADVDNACYGDGNLKLFSCFGRLLLHNSAGEGQQDVAITFSPASATVIQLPSTKRHLLTQMATKFKPDCFSTITFPSLATLFDSLYLDSSAFYILPHSTDVVLPPEEKISMRTLVSERRLWVISDEQNHDDIMRLLGGLRFEKSWKLGHLDGHNPRRWFRSDSAVLTIGARVSSSAVGIAANMSHSDRFSAGYALILPQESIMMKISQIIDILMDEAQRRRKKDIKTILFYTNADEAQDYLEALKAACKSLEHRLQYVIVAIGRHEEPNSFVLNHHLAFEACTPTFGTILSHSEKMKLTWKNSVAAMTRECCFVSDLFKKSENLPVPLLMANEWSSLGNILMESKITEMTNYFQ